MEKYGKIARFSGRIWPDWGNNAQADMAGLGKYFTGGYGRIGKILHRRIWPDWENTAQADMARLGKYGTGGYGQIGVSRVKGPHQRVCNIVVILQRGLNEPRSHVTERYVTLRYVT